MHAFQGLGGMERLQVTTKGVGFLFAVMKGFWQRVAMGA